jgi:hypothetical protein
MNGAHNDETEMQQTAAIVILCVAFVIFAALATHGCGPPTTETLQLPSVPVGDPPPQPNPDTPAATMARLRAVQSRCWAIRLDWHYTRGWTVWAWPHTTGLTSRARTAEGPTLEGVLMEVQP